MDGLPLYDRIGDLPQKPNIAVIYTPAEGVRDAIAECAAARDFDHHGGGRICAGARRARCGRRSRAQRAVGSSARIRSAFSCRAGGCSAPSRRAFASKGRLAVIVRSGTVALALARQLTLAGIGQRIVAHIGGDSVIGRNPHEYLQALADDEATAAVLYCGEIGGDKEYAFADAARGFAKARHRHGRRPPCAGAKANGPCRRADRQRARKRGSKTRCAGRRRLPEWRKVWKRP